MSTCTRCSSEAAPGASFCEDCRQMEAVVHRERVETALQRMPPALREWRLEALDGQDDSRRAAAIAAAHELVEDNLVGLMLLGPVGVGKTTIAAATVGTYAERNPSRPARWLQVQLALMKLGRPFKDPERMATLDALTETPALFMGRVSRPLGPLVLDDLDKSSPSKSAAEQLFAAIDLCVTHSRPLIVTTNLLPSEIARRWPQPFGEAIASRLVGHCRVLRVDGHDRRTTPILERTGSAA
jgi:DNA replication protein DnaC